MVTLPPLTWSLSIFKLAQGQQQAILVQPKAADCGQRCMRPHIHTSILGLVYCEWLSVPFMAQSWSCAAMMCSCGSVTKLVVHKSLLHMRGLHSRDEVQRVPVKTACFGHCDSSGAAVVAELPQCLAQDWLCSSVNTVLLVT